MKYVAVFIIVMPIVAIAFIFISRNQKPINSPKTSPSTKAPSTVGSSEPSLKGSMPATQQEHNNSKRQDVIEFADERLPEAFVYYLCGEQMLASVAPVPFPPSGTVRWYDVHSLSPRVVSSIKVMQTLKSDVNGILLYDSPFFAITVLPANGESSRRIFLYTNQNVRDCFDVLKEEIIRADHQIAHIPDVFLVDDRLRGRRPDPGSDE